MLCVVGPGTSFGEGILTGKPHSVTVVTKDTTELLRVELKDFKLLWEVRTGAWTPTSRSYAAHPGQCFADSTASNDGDDDDDDEYDDGDDDDDDDDGGDDNICKSRTANKNRARHAAHNSNINYENVETSRAKRQ